MDKTALYLCTFAALWAACSEEQLPPLELADHCNPLAAGSCLLPWPSSFFLEADATTATGRRVHYPPEALPATASGAALDPARYNALDGFSIASQILVTFTGGVGPRGLPSQEELESSTSDQSPILIIDMERGERVPLFAELDANVELDQSGAPKEPPALIIRPQQPLRFNTRYLVALRAGLEDASGAPLAAPEPFRRLRDGDPIQSPPLARVQQREEEVFIALAAQGVTRSELVLAWDFFTASEVSSRGRLKGMVEGSDHQGSDSPDGPVIWEGSRMMNSTRRFLARPALVRLSAIGRVSP